MRRIGALVFPGFELLDIYGPMEMFGLLTKQFDLTLVAETVEPVESNQRLKAMPDVAVREAGDFDVLFVPGGAGTRREVGNSVLLDWIARSSERAEYTLSICTGAGLLAKAGVLDGKRATTNKMAFHWVAEQGPNVHWVREARWVEDGAFVTSSGVSAGMDMALGVIALMHGTDASEKVAKWSEYAGQRDKDHDPFAKLHGLV